LRTTFRGGVSKSNRQNSNGNDNSRTSNNNGNGNGNGDGNNSMRTDADDGRRTGHTPTRLDRAVTPGKDRVSGDSFENEDNDENIVKYNENVIEDDDDNDDSIRNENDDESRYTNDLNSVSRNDNIYDSGVPFNEAATDADNAEDIQDGDTHSYGDMNKNPKARREQNNHRGIDRNLSNSDSTSSLASSVTSSVGQNGTNSQGRQSFSQSGLMHGLGPGAGRHQSSAPSPTPTMRGERDRADTGSVSAALVIPDDVLRELKELRSQLKVTQNIASVKTEELEQLRRQSQSELEASRLLAGSLQTQLAEVFDQSAVQSRHLNAQLVKMAKDLETVTASEAVLRQKLQAIEQTGLSYEKYESLKTTHDKLTAENALLFSRLEQLAGKEQAVHVVRLEKSKAKVETVLMQTQKLYAQAKADKEKMEEKLQQTINLCEQYKSDLSKVRNEKFDAQKQHESCWMREHEMADMQRRLAKRQAEIDAVKKELKEVAVAKKALQRKLDTVTEDLVAGSARIASLEIECAEARQVHASCSMNDKELTELRMEMLAQLETAKAVQQNYESVLKANESKMQALYERLLKNVDEGHKLSVEHDDVLKESRIIKQTLEVEQQKHQDSKLRFDHAMQRVQAKLSSRDAPLPEDVYAFLNDARARAETQNIDRLPISFVSPRTHLVKPPPGFESVHINMSAVSHASFGDENLNVNGDSADVDQLTESHLGSVSVSPRVKQTNVNVSAADWPLDAVTVAKAKAPLSAIKPSHTITGILNIPSLEKAHSITSPRILRPLSAKTTNI
jgi:hypothetical protein